jgi:hypothetical protein
MNVICIEEEAFYALIETVYKRLANDGEKKRPDGWINDQQAMQLLDIKSKTTLTKLKNTGCIKFSYVTPRKIMYDAVSINDYLEKKAMRCF